jgi:type IV pilus biogenesis protein CpaD/CtpE
MRKVFWLIVIGLFLSGCAGNPWRPSRDWDPWSRSDLENNFGSSFKQALANQTLNPDASENLAPVTGMDGKSAEKVLETYRKSYEKEQAAPTYIFNVGQGAGK